jgi:LytS/YehU family sensor histidine kinase
MRLLPPMALQMLIENAIKHNEVGSETPLTIMVKAKNDQLEVTNNLQLRKQESETSKSGLSNISARYGFFTEREIRVEQTASTFSVTLPLLSKK